MRKKNPQIQKKVREEYSKISPLKNIQKQVEYLSKNPQNYEEQNYEKPTKIFEINSRRIFKRKYLFKETRQRY